MSCTGEPKAGAPSIDTTVSAVIPSYSHTSNFNSQPIAAGTTIWFSTVVKVSGVGSTPVHVYISPSSISFTADAVTYDLTVPNGVLTIDPAATSAATTFDAATGYWRTTIPQTYTNNAFIAALPYRVTTALPGGVKDVRWTASFESDAPVTLTWKWAAAVYTSFTTDPAQVTVKPVDGNSYTPYPGSHKAGTPESFTSYLVAGGTGNGGSNYTGNAMGGVNLTPARPCDGVACDAPDQCQSTNTCDPTSGACVATATADGTPCSDGDACTQTDACNAGSCVGSSPVVCTASDQCHVAGACDPSTGACSNPSAADGTSCSDGDACTQTDACNAGSCVGSSPVVCTASDECHVAGVCDPSTGVCSNPHVEGACCGDGIAEGGETCDDGNLVSGDGCDAACAIEYGYACTGSPSVCATVCGDGVCGGAETGAACAADCWLRSELVASGLYFSCAILDGGTVRCWGQSFYGQLGLGDMITVPYYLRGDVHPRVRLGAGRTAQSLALGSVHTCALLDDQSVKCWGHNGSGQLGLGDTSNRGDGPREMGDALPNVSLGTGRSAIGIASGPVSDHTCAILDDQTLKCWGSNDYGQLGTGDTTARGGAPGQMGDALPTIDLGTGRTVRAVAVGQRFTCAILDDGSVKCWGYNIGGQLGIGSTASSWGTVPSQMGDGLPAVNLGTARTALALSAGALHVCALLDDQTVKCWGTNGYGELGIGSTVSSKGRYAGDMGDALPAVNLGTGRTALGVEAGRTHTCAILDDRTVKCWGENWDYQLGVGDRLDRGTSPSHMGDALPRVGLGAGSRAVSVAAGSHHNCALLDDGAVRCWGLTSYDLIGDAQLSRRDLGLWNPCGDAIVTAPEQCDAGDSRSSDGCSPSCTIEPGYACTGWPMSDCTWVCGDGIRVAFEGCDDGNTTSGDGCNAACEQEFDVDLVDFSATFDDWSGLYVVTTTACNMGPNPSRGALTYRLSTDAVVDESDPVWFTPTYPAEITLAPGTCGAFSEELIPDRFNEFFGTYTAGAIFVPDERVSDVDSSNDFVAGNQVTIGADLTPTDVTLTTLPEWGVYQIDFTVCNVGTDYTSAVVRVRVSTDELIDVSDPYATPNQFSFQLYQGYCYSDFDYVLFGGVPPGAFLGVLVEPAEDLDSSNDGMRATSP